MKLIEQIRLGHKNLVANRRKSIMVIVVMGVLLSVIVALNLFVNGLKAKTLQLGNAREDGKVLLWTTLNESFIELPEDYVEGTPIEVEKKVMTAEDRSEVRERIGKMGGEVVEGLKLLTYEEGEVERQWVIVPSELMGRAMEVAPEKMPEGALPLFLPASTSTAYTLDVAVPERGRDLPRRRLEALKEILAKGLGKEIKLYGSEQEFYVVGMAPSALTSMELPGEGLNPLNLILAFAPTASTMQVMIVDDGSGRIERTIPEGVMKEMDGVMALFPDAETAYKYATMAENTNTYVGTSSQKYWVEEYFNNAVGATVSYRVIDLMVGILSAVLTAVALIVILFTIIRVVKQEIRNAALYRALGATRGETMMVYLWYAVELCWWTVVFAVVLGLILALVVGGINQEALNSVMSTAYGKVLTGPMILLGWGSALWLIVGAVMVTALISVLLTSGQFKDNKLMEKLKTT